MTIIEPASELGELHTSLVAVVKSGGGIFDDPEFIEDGYRARDQNPPRRDEIG